MNAFDDLERQLRAAVQRAVAVPKWRWWRRRMAFVAVPALLVSGAALAAETGVAPSPWQHEPKSPAAAREMKLQLEAMPLLNRATRHVNATVAGCKSPKPQRKQLPPIHGAPVAGTLRVLSPLRRPATASDSPPRIARLFARQGFASARIYVDATRNITAPDGARFTLMIGRGVPTDFTRSSRCFDADHAYLLKLLRDKRASLRKAALKEFDRWRTDPVRHRPKPRAAMDQIFLFQPHGGGGGLDIGRFRERGVFKSGTEGLVIGGGKPIPHSTTVYGLVPDGVATVTLEYGKVVGGGRYLKPTIYPSGATRSGRVTNNLVAIRVPRDPFNALRAKMTWRDAGGKVIRRITKQPL